MPRQIDPVAPPHSLEAEQAVLGSLILFPDGLEAIAGILEPGHFYHERHRHLFEAILEALDGGALDPLTLEDTLSRRGLLEAIGGRSYLAVLPQAVIAPENIAFHAAIIRRKARLRALITMAREIMDAAMGEREDEDQIVLEAEARVTAAVRSIVATPVTARMTRLSLDNGKSADFITQMVKDADEGRQFIPSISTVLNQRTGGLPASGITIVQALMGMGKTTWAAAQAVQTAQHFLEDRPGARVSIVTTEESVEPILRRIAAITFCIARNEFKAPMSAKAKAALDVVKSGLAMRLPLQILFCPHPTIREIEEAVEEDAREHGGLPALLIIDFAQRIKLPSDSSGKKAWNAEADLMGEIRRLFCARGIAVLLMVQDDTDRDSIKSKEQRKNRKHGTGLLRPRGSLAWFEGADLPIALNRQSYFDPPEGQRPFIEDFEAVIWQKRDLEPGAFPLVWCPSIGRFGDTKDSLLSEIQHERDLWRDQLTPKPTQTVFTKASCPEEADDDPLDRLPF